MASNTWTIATITTMIITITIAEVTTTMAISEDLAVVVVVQTTSTLQALDVAETWTTTTTREEAHTCKEDLATPEEVTACTIQMAEAVVEDTTTTAAEVDSVEVTWATTRPSSASTLNLVRIVHTRTSALMLTVRKTSDKVTSKVATPVKAECRWTSTTRTSSWTISKSFLNRFRHIRTTCTNLCILLSQAWTNRMRARCLTDKEWAIKMEVSKISLWSTHNSSWWIPPWCSRMVIQARVLRSTTQDRSMAVLTNSSRPTLRTCSSIKATRFHRCILVELSNKSHNSQVESDSSLKLRSWCKTPLKDQMASRLLHRREWMWLFTRAARNCLTSWRLWVNCARLARVTRDTRCSWVSKVWARFRSTMPVVLKLSLRRCRWTCRTRCSRTRARMDRVPMEMAWTRIRSSSITHLNEDVWMKLPTMRKYYWRQRDEN